MRGTLTGDFGGLERFAKKIEKLSSPTALTSLSRALADEALNLALDGFSKEQDPFGRPWFPKRYPDGRKILRGATGQLGRSFFKAAVSADGFTIGNKARHAPFVQKGTGIYGPKHKPIVPKAGKALRFRGPNGKFMFRKSSDGSPPRPILPTSGKLPPAWNVALNKRAVAFLKKRLGRSG